MCFLLIEKSPPSPSLDLVLKTSRSVTWCILSCIPSWKFLHGENNFFSTSALGRLLRLNLFVCLFVLFFTTVFRLNRSPLHDYLSVENWSERGSDAIYSTVWNLNSVERQLISDNLLLTFVLTKGWGSKRQLYKFYTVANLHYQFGW